MDVRPEAQKIPTTVEQNEKIHQTVEETPIIQGLEAQETYPTFELNPMLSAGGTENTKDC